VDFDDFLPSDPSFEQGQAEIDRETLGGYLFGQVKPHRKVALNGGARYEVTRTDFKSRRFDPSARNKFLQTNRGTFPNPNFSKDPVLIEDESFDQRVIKRGVAGEGSINYRPTPQWSLWAGYDRLYRYPVIDETAAFQGFILAEPVNLDLEPETGDQYDLGTKYQSDPWTAALTLYWLELDGEIIFDNVQNLNRNVGNSRRIGTDLSLAFDQKHYGARTQWAFVDARFTSGPFDGSIVPLVPWTHGVTSFWIRPVEWLRTTFFYTYEAERFQGSDFDNELRKVERFARIDTRLTIEPREGLEVFAQVNNVLDKQHASFVFRGAYFPSPGRNYRAGIRYSF